MSITSAFVCLSPQWFQNIHNTFASTKDCTPCSGVMERERGRRDVKVKEDKVGGRCEVGRGVVGGGGGGSVPHGREMTHHHIKGLDGIKGHCHGLSPQHRLQLC